MPPYLGTKYSPAALLLSSNHIKPETAAYFLTTEDGQKIKLPASKKSQDLDKYADANVSIEARGMKKEKGGKTIITIKEITKIEQTGDGDATIAPQDENMGSEDEGNGGNEGDGGDAE